jgi:hypothetical protein
VLGLLAQLPDDLAEANHDLLLLLMLLRHLLPELG